MWHLLGTAVDAVGETPPAQQIQENATRRVPDLTSAWAGRWVLIGNGELHLDAIGMLGVVYDPGAGTISSSPSLITRRVTPDYPQIRHSDAVNWYVAPATGFQGLRRLLPSQILDLATLTVRARPLTVELPAMSYDEVLERIQAALVRTLRAYTAGGRRVFLPLTGGYDSRLMLSALKYAGIPAETYTLPKQGISWADLTFPPRLARMAGRKFRRLRSTHPAPHPEARELYHDQSAGHAIEQDQHWLAHGQFDWLEEGDLVLIGGAFETGRCFYWKRLPAGEPSVEAFVQGFGPLPDHTVAALTEWLGWVARTPHDMDWRDRVYWEQRLGSWLSICSQAMDIANGTRLTPANSRYLLSLLLQVPAEKRRTSQHHVDLMTRMAPELLRLPLNPKDPLALRVIRRASREVRQGIRRLSAGSR